MHISWVLCMFGKRSINTEPVIGAKVSEKSYA
jgi:hypothetical protein